MNRTVLVFPLVILLFSIQVYFWLQAEPMIPQSHATGGAGQIAEMVMSKLEDAKTYLDEGDVPAAQQEIQDAINELKDTYEADQEEAK